MAEDMAKALMDSITGYTERAKKQMDASARTIQNQMKNMIQANTPVRQLTWKAGNGIIIKYQAPEKYNPGRMKKSWTVKTYTTKTGGKIYGVPNRAVPTLVHLVAKGHELVSHGKHVGTVQGNDFIAPVQEWGVQQLDAKIKEILKGER